MSRAAGGALMGRASRSMAAASQRATASVMRAPAAVARAPQVAFPVAVRCQRSLAASALPPAQHGIRLMCTAPPSTTAAEELSDLYGEAKELMGDAEDSKGSRYFEEDLEDAREAIEELIARYATAKTELPPSEAEALTQLVGLKVEELRSRLAVMMESLVHDDD